MTEETPAPQGNHLFDGVMDFERVPVERHVDKELGIVESVLRSKTTGTYLERDDEGKSHCRYPRFKESKGENEFEFDQMLAHSSDLIAGQTRHLRDYQECLHLWFWYFTEILNKPYIRTLMSRVPIIQKRFPFVHSAHQLRDTVRTNKTYGSFLLHIAIQHRCMTLGVKILSICELAFISTKDIELLVGIERYDLLQLIWSRKLLIFNSHSYYLNLWKYTLFTTMDIIQDFFPIFDFKWFLKQIIEVNREWRQKTIREITLVLNWEFLSLDRRIMAVLIKRGFGTVASGLLRDESTRRRIVRDYRIFLDSIRIGEYETAHLFELMHHTKIKAESNETSQNPLNHTAVQIQLLDMMSQNEKNSTLYALYFLRRALMVCKLNISIVKRLHTKLERLLLDDHLRKHLFFKLKNPVGYCILAVELLNQMGEAYPQFRDSLDLTGSRYNKLTLLLIENINENINEEFFAQRIFGDKDLEGRSYIKIMMNQTDLYFNIVRNNQMHTLVDEIWDPNGDDGEIIPREYSQCYQCLRGNIVIFDWFPYMYNLAPDLEVNLKLKYESWRGSVAIRKFYDFVFLNILAIVLIIISVRGADIVVSLQKAKEDDDDEQIEYYQEKWNEVWEFWYYVAYFFIGYYLWEVWQLIYRYKVNKRVFFWDYYHTPGYLIIMAGFYYPIWQYKLFDMIGMSDVTRELSVQAIFIFLLFYKIFSLSLILKQIGPLAKLIGLMIKDVSYFLVIDLLILVLMALIFMQFLYDTDDRYNSPEIAIRSLLDATYQNYNYQFEGEYHWVGKPLIIIFIVFNSILMINYLIAILSNTYSNFLAKADVEYYKILFNLADLSDYDPKYGSIVVTPFMVTPILTPFLIALLCIKDEETTKRLNDVLSRASFALFYVPLNLILFVIWNLLLLFPAYFKIGYLLAFTGLEGRCQTILNSITWLFLGIPILLYHILYLNVSSFYRSIWGPWQKTHDLETEAQVYSRSYEIAKQLINRSSAMPLATFYKRVTESLNLRFAEMTFTSDASSEEKDSPDISPKKDSRDKVLPFSPIGSKSKISFDNSDLSVTVSHIMEDQTPKMTAKETSKRNSCQLTPNSPTSKNLSKISSKAKLRRMSNFSSMGSQNSHDDVSANPFPTERHLIKTKTEMKKAPDFPARTSKRTATYYYQRFSVGKLAEADQGRVGLFNYRQMKRLNPIFYNILLTVKHAQSFVADRDRDMFETFLEKFCYYSHKGVRMFDLRRFTTIMNQQPYDPRTRDFLPNKVVIFSSKDIWRALFNLRQTHKAEADNLEVQEELSHLRKLNRQLQKENQRLKTQNDCHEERWNSANPTILKKRANRPSMLEDVAKPSGISYLSRLDTISRSTSRRSSQESSDLSSLNHRFTGARRQSFFARITLGSGDASDHNN